MIEGKQSMWRTIKNQAKSLLPDAVKSLLKSLLENPLKILDFYPSWLCRREF